MEAHSCHARCRTGCRSHSRDLWPEACEVSREVQDALARSSEVAEETFAGVRTVRAFSGNRERFLATKPLWSEGSSSRVAVPEWPPCSRASPVSQLCCHRGCPLVRRHSSAGGHAGFGQLTSFLLYTFNVASASAYSGVLVGFCQGLWIEQAVFELIDSTPVSDDEGLTLATVEGRIRLEQVDFAYPTRPDTPVLTGLDLELEPELVALVGPSGGGKSTVAALISRLYDPETGRFSRWKCL